MLIHAFTETSRIGRMSKWHRTVSMVSVFMCFGTGFIWFCCEDILELLPKHFRTFSILHGIIGQLFLLIIGMALLQHVQVCLRAKRNVGWGLALLGICSVSIVSMWMLFYGGEGMQQIAHWVHVLSGFSLVSIFFLHISKGRKVVSSLLKLSSK